MFEKKSQRVITRHRFVRRLAKSAGCATLIVALSLGGGMSGYMYFENMTAVDAFVNAAMLLSGMGPLTPLTTNAGKIFAGIYALYSGLAFIAATGIVVAPIFHRFFHRFHLE